MPHGRVSNERRWSRRRPCRAWDGPLQSTALSGGRDSTADATASRLAIPLPFYSFESCCGKLRVECHPKERTPPLKVVLPFFREGKACGASLSSFGTVRCDDRAEIHMNFPFESVDSSLAGDDRESQGEEEKWRTRHPLDWRGEVHEGRGGSWWSTSPRVGSPWLSEVMDQGSQSWSSGVVVVWGQGFSLFLANIVRSSTLFVL